MENTNKKRYWLRGSVVGLIVDFLVVGIFLVWPGSCIGLTQDGVTCVPPGLFDDLDIRLGLLVNQTAIMSMAGSILIFGLIGWSYGMFKNRKTFGSVSDV